MAWNDTKNCPVCGRKILVSGLKSHIIGSAKQEVYEWYVAKESIPTPHQTYIEKNSEDTTIRTLKV